MGDITLVEMGGLVLGLLLTGVLAGVLAGLLGVGGGIVVVPVLFYVFALLAIDPAVRMHLAVGTSLAIIVPTSLRSARSHYHAGTVDTGLLRDLGLSLLAGVLLSVALSAMVSGRLLTAVFGIMAVLVAINMARTSGPPRITGTPPRGALRHGIGAFIGSVSTMMGIGGGTLSVPTLDALGYPIRRSIGTAAAIGTIISVPGAVGFIMSFIMYRLTTSWVSASPRAVSSRRQGAIFAAVTSTRPGVGGLRVDQRMALILQADAGELLRHGVADEIRHGVCCGFG